ncbi:MAG TPA: diaminopimelate decarboxylase [Bryobacteraceae bacterium]|nr:diaminopimelate decarboxylase [Bryobacteraceae bacterium]
MSQTPRPLEYCGRTLSMDGVDLAAIAAKAGTPCYVYSAAEILNNYRAYESGFGEQPHTVCYAVKAASNLSILRLLAGVGAGFDIVSGGELFRVLKAGGDARKVVFSGAGKSATEVEAALRAGIGAFNCESAPEMALIDALAHRLGVKARVAVRVNPDVEAATHAYISTGRLAHKFGVDIELAEEAYECARRYENLLAEGVSCHIGSQLLEPEPVMRAADRVLELIERLRRKGFDIRHVDFGGGLGVAYKPGDKAPDIGEFVKALAARVQGWNLHVMIEPGRSIAASAGVLLARVLYRKKSGEKEFAIVDAGMNDLIRPALYSAHHEIVPLRQPTGGSFRADVVGPVCETGDFLARERELAELLPGDLVAICTAGAYGFVQASNYNSRPRAAEVMVENGGWRVIRRRETYEDLVRGEDSGRLDA